MGLFSLKEHCSICGKEVGLNRWQIKGKLCCCPECFKKSGLTTTSNLRNLAPADIERMIKQKEDSKSRLEEFQITKEVGGFLKIDENRREWYIPDGLFGKTKNPTVHSYDDIIDFELLEDGGSIAKGGLGRAVAGGLLFGGVGAIVGGTTGKRKSTSTCTSLKIKITLKDLNSPAEYINLISTETKKDSMIYKACESRAQEIMSVLQVMCENNNTNYVQNNTPSVTTSDADEIKKFKELLDQGIISQEEFNAKKKQILGI